MRVRLPNTDEYVIMEIDMSQFKQDLETDTEIFGWYKNNYIAILRECRLPMMPALPVFLND